MKDSDTHSETLKTLGLYLKKRRIEKGLTQSEVAEKLGYGSPQFISNIERGISNVPVKSLKTFVDLYEVPAQEVLEILLEQERRYLSEQLGITAPAEKSKDMSSGLTGNPGDLQA